SNSACIPSIPAALLDWRDFRVASTSDLKGSGGISNAVGCQCIRCPGCSNFSVNFPKRGGFFKGFPGCAEGIVVVQMVEDILKNCAERESGKIHLVENRTAKIPKKLIWKLEKCLQQEIDNIGTELDREMENLDVLIHTYDGYGKELVKKNSISPDVFIQVVLQLTYYRIYGCLGATYESASTRRFRKGRVDCIRAATPEALEWVKAMTSEGALNEERLSKFKRAVNAQTEIMTDNILGRGIDIHLMGIKEAAKELGIKLSLFDSPAFKKANHFCLSTSQVLQLQVEKPGLSLENDRGRERTPRKRQSSERSGNSRDRRRQEENCQTSQGA
ncbi:hypothetical protein QYM36_004317, partial [Artemia franciscana]